MGLLQQMPAANQQTPAGQPAAPNNPAAGKQQKFARVLEAAQKLMYSEKTRPLFLKLLEGKDKLDVASTAAVKVILTIVDETKGQLDPVLVVPAGVAIVGDILDFIEKTEGVEISTEQTHQAVQMFLQKIQQAIKNGGDSMIDMPAGAQNGA